MIEQTLLSAIYIIFHAAVIATVYVFLLVGRGGPLKSIPGIVRRMTSNESIHKIMYGCTPCIAGQVAFWWTILSIQNIPLAILTAVYAAFLAYFLEKLFQKLEQ